MTRCVAWFTLTLALCACTNANPQTPITPRHVILIVLDATQAAQLGCYGGDARVSPELDALAASGTRFTNAVSSATWTLPSTTSLMTGLLQEHHGVITNHHALADDGVPTLAERFAEAGWRTAGFVQMVYASDAYGLDRGFDTYDYYASAAEKREDGRAILDVREWLDDRAADGRSSFTYAHFRRPHSPYDPNVLAVSALGVNPNSVTSERLDVLMHADSQVRDINTLAPGELELLRGMYRANILSIDERLASIFDWARAHDDALVIVTADHGEALGEHEHFGHGDLLYREHVGIPLIVAGAGVVASVRSERVTTVDVSATLADLCNLDAEAHAFDGASLAPALRGDELASRTVFTSGRYQTAGTPPAAASKDERWSVIRNRDGSVALFDITTDPEERTDVADDHPDVVRNRLDALEQLVDRGMRSTVPGATRPELDADRRAALRALGYIDDDDR